MKKKTKFHVLGTEWTCIRETLEEEPSYKDCDGWCDPSVKEIHVRVYTDEEKKADDFAYANREEIDKRVIVHEIIHAYFFSESSDFAFVIRVFCIRLPVFDIPLSTFL